MRIADVSTLIQLAGLALVTIVLIRTNVRQNKHEYRSTLYVKNAGVQDLEVSVLSET